MNIDNAHIMLVAKARHKEAFNTAEIMALWLKQHGCIGIVCTADEDQHRLQELARGARAVVVLGGDGTFIGVARALMEFRVPFLGINFGRVGFLAEVPAAAWQASLQALIDGTATIETRALVRWSIIRKGEELFSGHAVNDIVVSRGALARLLAIHVQVNSEPLGWIRSDGLIVATPLGTSGYAQSAGGSLMLPQMQAMSLTAISPFLNSFPSMVLPADSVLTLEVEPSRDVFVTVDGQDGFTLNRGDVVRASCEPEGLHFVVPDKAAYFRRLRQCGFIQEYVPKSSEAKAFSGDDGKVESS